MRSKPIVLFVLFVFCMSFAGCFTSDNPADETAVTPTTTDRALGLDSNSQISISTSQVSVKTDNSDKATITATVIDSDNSVIEGAVVSFSASGGQLSAGSATTNKDGQASVDFSCGTIERSNRIVTIEASVEGLGVRQIPIQVVGTTIDIISHGTTSLSIDGRNSDNLTVMVKDSGGNPIYDTTVSLSLASSSTGSIAFSPGSGKTAVNGTLDVAVTGVAVGIATLNISALGAASSIDYTISSIIKSFAIQSPTDEVVSLYTGEDLTVTVYNPSPGSSKTVMFATSFGSWKDGGQVLEVPITSSNTASAVFSSMVSGVASIQVYDKDTPSITDKLTIAISAPSSEAALISIQSDYAIIPPSIGGTLNEVTLVVTVTTSNGQVVGGSPVLFSLGNTTGGGEFVYPTIAYTDDYGVAKAKFTSGTKSSDAAGVKIIASLVENLVITDDTNIIIGGTAASLVVGRATYANLSGSGTSYIDPMSLLVSDSNGNPMAGAVISLKIWPIYYAIGDIDDFPDHNPADIFENEDRNRNLTLDPDEDKNIFGFVTDPNHGDGELTPANSTAGNLPATVVTDENGLAEFNLVYLKDYAFWVKVEVEASTIVMGASTKSTLSFWLPTEKTMIYLPDSPFNP